MAIAINDLIVSFVLLHFYDNKDIQEYIEKNKIAQEQFADGMSLLHLASLTKRVELIKYLVEKKGLDINAQTKNGYTPLHFAVGAKQQAVVDYFISKGADTTLKAIATKGNQEIEVTAQDMVNAINQKAGKTVVSIPDMGTQQSLTTKKIKMSPIAGSFVSEKIAKYNDPATWDKTLNARRETLAIKNKNKK